jgi:hypothetical protein
MYAESALPLSFLVFLYLFFCLPVEFYLHIRDSEFLFGLNCLGFITTQDILEHFHTRLPQSAQDPMCNFNTHIISLIQYVCLTSSSVLNTSCHSRNTLYIPHHMSVRTPLTTLTFGHSSYLLSTPEISTILMLIVRSLNAFGIITFTHTHTLVSAYI